MSKFDQSILDAAFDSIPQIVWTARPDGWFDYYNRRWFEYTGLTLEQTKGWGWGPVLHADDLLLCIEKWSKAVQTGQSYEVEYRFKRASDGMYRWHLGRALPIRDAQGKIVKWFGTCTDIDDQRRLHAREQAALEASRMKSEFLANMSHEIRTPINGVIGMTSLLLTTPLSAEQREYAETIQTSAASLMTVVSDILDLSKVEAGKLDLECIPFELSALLQQTVKTMSFDAQSKGIGVRVELCPDLPKMLRGDPGRLRQILINLINNSIKFTERGEVVVSASLIASAGEEVQIRFEVKDSGIGIPERIQGRLFEPFSQADESTTRKFGGTGLGLSICRRLVRLMKGEISFESQPGLGSTFWFTVTMLRGSEELVREPGLRTQLSLPSGNGLRILVVEDNPVNGRLARRMLEKLGCVANEIEDGQDVIASLEQDHYDVVLMDCQMKTVDGYEATARIRNHPDSKIRKTPVIAMTANAIKGERENCLASGMSDYIAKPVEFESLAAVVLKHAPVIVAASAVERLKEVPGTKESNLFSELLELFESMAPKRLSLMATSVESKNLKVLSREAHSLKSSCATLGAKALSEVCAEIEGMRFSLEALPRLFSRLVFEHERAIQELRRHDGSRKVTA